MPTTEHRCPACGTRNRLPVVARGRPRCGSCSRDLPWLVEAADSEFDQAIADSLMPVLVDLWAPWCGPCRMVAPALEQLSAERAGQVRVVKVNVDEAPRVSASLGVQSIPTLVLFDGGVEVARQVGALPAERMAAWLEQHLGRSPAR